MEGPTIPEFRRPRLSIMLLVVILLLIRLFASVTIAGLDVSNETRIAVGQAIDAYEITLPFVLLFIILFLFLRPLGSTRPIFFYTFLLLHIMAMISWIPLLAVAASRNLIVLLVVFATASLIFTSYLALGISGFGRGEKGWQKYAFVGYLAIIPVTFVIRGITVLGLTTFADEEGVLVGNWPLVNLPTLLLEFLSIGVWLSMASGFSLQDLRRKWFAFLPFIAVPLMAIIFQIRPLVGFIFSALITWGTNLALFVPITVSLTLAVLSVACFLSTLLLLYEKGAKKPWSLFSIGVAASFIAGFHLSMASVEGLSFGMLLVAISISVWRRRALVKAP